MGETFVAEQCWDWRIFEASQNELSETETELFARHAPISSEDVIDLHCKLAGVESLRQLAETVTTPENVSSSEKAETAKKSVTETKTGVKKSAEPNPKKTPRSEDGNAR
jgi:hypothetical protein